MDGCFICKIAVASFPVIYSTQPMCAFSTGLPEHSTYLYQTRHSDFPQGKTGIPRTQTCARKDDIPAHRFAFGGMTDINI